MALSKPSDRLNEKHFTKLFPLEDSLIAFLPIKPEFAFKIIDGLKHYEFRRAPINFNITHVVIYASSPVKRIIGIAEVERVAISHPLDMWEATKEVSGVPRSFFFSYFNGKDKGYAIQIRQGTILKFKEGIDPKKISSDFKIPQSFMYVDAEFCNKLFKLVS